MSFIKNRFNRVFCKSRTVCPMAKSPDFCANEIHDPLFDCCFAGLDLDLDDFQKYDVNLVKNPKKRKKKRKKNNHRSTSTTNTCRSKISPIRSKSINDLTTYKVPCVVKCCTPKSVENLCEQLDGIGINAITPRITKLYTKIPEHDKKILKRMAMKRTQEIALIVSFKLLL